MSSGDEATCMNMVFQLELDKSFLVLWDRLGFPALSHGDFSHSTSNKAV